MRSLRVGVTCNSFAQSGGMEKYALGVIEALIELGHKPIVFCKKADKNIPVYKDCEVLICPFKWLPSKLRTAYFSQWLIKIRQKVKVDCVIGCCQGGGQEIVACGGNHIGYLNAMHRAPRFWDTWTINAEKRQYEMAKVVVAHSDMMRRELLEFYKLPKSKVTVIYPPQELSVRTGIVDKIVLRKKLNLPIDKKLFLFPSSSHKRKGFDLLKQYFSNTKFDECLVVAGRPIDGQYKNILYIGFVNNMVELYQACDYTVMASLYEPLGLVPIEGICCGTPAIVSSMCGCRECIDQEAVKTFEAQNINSFETVMRDLRENPINLKMPYQQYLKVSLGLTYKDHVQKLLTMI